MSVAWLAGCIQNDLPFPRIPQNIIAVAAVGESKQAYIDSIAFEVNLYLDETVDIENVSFSEYRITPERRLIPIYLKGHTISHLRYT